MQTSFPVLNILSDGCFHSGEELGKALGITRAAIWKQLEVLKSYGLKISAVPGKGYRIPDDIELLSEREIQSGLAGIYRDSLERIHIHHHIDSTNTFLAHQPPCGPGRATLCLAEQQSAGRGRRGRNWVSPFGYNLYLSLARGFPGGLETLGGLSLVVGIALMRMLRKQGCRDASLKWPNDVICPEGKLAGILVELSGDVSGPSQAIIGVGVNVAMPKPYDEQINQAWTDLSSQSSEDISRNELAVALTTELLEAIRQFEQTGLLGFMNEWRGYDITYGKQVNIDLLNNRISGVAMGIDEGGALLVDINGERRRFTSGEISLRITE